MQAQSATDAEQRDRLLYDAKWYDLLAETQYINGDYVVNSNATGGQFIMKVTNRTPSTGSIQEVCDCTLIMYYNGTGSSQCKTLSVPAEQGSFLFRGQHRPPSTKSPPSRTAH